MNDVQSLVASKTTVVAEAAVKSAVPETAVQAVSKEPPKSAAKAEPLTQSTNKELGAWWEEVASDDKPASPEGAGSETVAALTTDAAPDPALGAILPATTGEATFLPPATELVLPATEEAAVLPASGEAQGAVIDPTTGQAAGTEVVIEPPVTEPTDGEVQPAVEPPAEEKTPEQIAEEQRLAEEQKKADEQREAEEAQAQREAEEQAQREESERVEEEAQAEEERKAEEEHNAEQLEEEAQEIEQQTQAQEQAAETVGAVEAQYDVIEDQLAARQAQVHQIRGRLVQYRSTLRDVENERARLVDEDYLLHDEEITKLDSIRNTLRESIHDEEQAALAADIELNRLRLKAAEEDRVAPERQPGEDKPAEDAYKHRDRLDEELHQPKAGTLWRFWQQLSDEGTDEPGQDPGRPKQSSGANPAEPRPGGSPPG